MASMPYHEDMRRSSSAAAATPTSEPQGQLIVQVPGIHGGEPVVRGTRVPVRSIVIAYERDGDIDHVARSFTLNRDQVEAALAYYQKHTEEIDQLIDERERDAMA
jgi:uncharacterized protein (DUF433 family)